MAFNHIHFNQSTQYGQLLRATLATNEKADDMLADLRDMMVQMINGDGTQDVHYAEITLRFGFVDDAGAHAAYLELDSAFSKTSGNASVANVRAARDQLYSKLRG